MVKSELSPEQKKENIERARQKKLVYKLRVGGVLAVLILLLSLNVVPLAKKLYFQYRYFIILALTIPVQVWVGSQSYKSLVVVFKYRSADMNTLVAVGALSAF